VSTTYESPEANDKDAIRFMVGDTDPSSALLQDEEINWLLTKWLPVHGTLEYVASVAAESIAAKYAREASFSADGVSISLANLGAQFRELAVSLRNQHKSLLVGGQPDVGGISTGEQPDPTIRPLDFGTGMHDNHEAGRQSYGQRDYSIGYYDPYEQPGA
jgi:hypothetical protein